MKKHLIILIMLCSVLPAQKKLEPTFTRRQVDMDTAKVSKILLMPTGAVSGYVLKTDGRGKASWAPATASAAWGSITGSLSSQTDLVAEFAGKQATIGNIGDTTKYLKKADTVRINFNDKRLMQYLKNPGAATGIVSGLTAPTLSGSQLSADDAFGPWLKHTTTAISGNAVGFVSAFTVMRSDWKPEMIIKVQLDTAAVTSVRYWAGMYSGSVDASSAPNVHGALFRYATDADGTVFWRCVTIAGTGASAQITTTTVPVAINIPYKLHIKNETTVVYFYINNQLVATHSSVVPTATQLMGWGARVVTLGAVKHNIRWSNVILLHN